MSAKWVLGAAAAVMVAASAEAGHHHRSRCCQPCGGAVVSQNGWYHFNGSTAGMYVPYAPATTTAAVPAIQTPPPLPTGQPPMAQGNGVTRRFSYEPGAVQPAGTVRPAASGGGVTETPTLAASPPAEPPRTILPREEARYEGQVGNPHVGETVFRRLHPGHGWRP